jgi:hypothetical protein
VNRRNSSKVEGSTTVLKALPATHMSCHLLTLKTIADIPKKSKTKIANNYGEEYQKSKSK